MRGRIHVRPIAVMTGVLALALIWSGLAFGRGAPESFADLAEQLLPAVVNISTTQVVSGRGPARGPLPRVPEGSPFEEFFDQFFNNQPGGNSPPRNVTSLGSGFIIDSSGIVITNNHVIDGATEIRVILHDDRVLNAVLVGSDPKTDIAVLRVEADGPLPAVAWGDSDVLRIGDWVMAIGNPFGLGGSVTAGIVSQRARDINAGPYDDFIQTDASINRGNSGGPLFDMDGEVVGINTAIFSPSGGSIGIGFAIPSVMARNVADQILEHGYARRGWLGVRIQNVSDEIAESLGLESARGALIAAVSENGPAADAGIKVGDVVLQFDGKDVEEMRRLPRIVAETAIGRSVPVRVWRNGAAQTVNVTVGELDEERVVNASVRQPQSSSGDTGHVDSLGLSLGDLSNEARRQYGVGAEVAGVLVVDVAPGSPAADKGLRPGDVVVEVGQAEVRSVGDVNQRIEEARQSGRRAVLLLVDRDGDLHFVAIRLASG
ncbi:MAG: DegQ family serine endoprotease [Alphaproteobacteria bacterium]